MQILKFNGSKKGEMKEEIQSIMTLERKKERKKER
jgi:hypothetical protein